MPKLAMTRAAAGTATCAALAVAFFAPAVVWGQTPAKELPAIMVLNIKHEEEAGPGIAKILTELVLQDLHDLKSSA